jgi:hypothetical protein
MIRFSMGVVAMASAVACSSSGVTPGRAMASGCNGGPQDSAIAAAVVLDTLGKLDPFHSKIYTFRRDSSGFRVTTTPAPPPRVTDGMAIVLLDRTCQITSLIQTDSA